MPQAQRQPRCGLPRRSLLLIAFLALPLLPLGAEAQIVQSERATLSQVVDGTVVSLDYGRPRIKGRGEPFGDIVWIGDHRWTPGADWATTITSNRPFELNGHRVPEGTWSMFIDLEEDAWTMILDPTDSIYHTFPPEDSDEQIRFEVEPREGPFVESLMFSIPATRISGFDMLLSWGTTEIPFEIAVEPTFDRPVNEADRVALEGYYAIQPDEGYAGPTIPFVVSVDGERLQVRTVDVSDHRPLEGRLLPRGADVYWLGETRAGRVFDIEVDIIYEAVRGDSGEIEGLDIRWADDTLLGRVRPTEPFTYDDAIAGMHAVSDADGRALVGEFVRQSDDQEPAPFDVTWADGVLMVESQEPGSERLLSGRLLPRGPDAYALGELDAHGELVWVFENLELQVVRDGPGAVLGLDIVKDGALDGTIRRKDGG